MTATAQERGAAASPLRPYQREAVDALTEGLALGGRGQLHAACGSGKTRIGAEVGARLVPADGLIVVLAPSLALVAQNLFTWREHHPVHAVLAVCSDDTVADAPVHLDDIPAEVTTNVAQIEGWLRRTGGRRMVVGTYISSGRLAEALRNLGMQADLLVCDEAHHLAGRPDYATRRVLDEEHLPARRHLFMTATPRIDEVKRVTMDGLSMSDQGVFGPVLYRYPFARAIREGYLDDYRIVVMGVSTRQIMEMLRDDEHEWLDRAAGMVDLRTLATQIVLTKAAAKYGLRRVLVFDARVNSAKIFARTLPGTVALLADDERPPMPLFSEHISGEMDQRRREQLLDALREPPQGGWTALANVRVLGEGVDVPAVDGVAFTRPKRNPTEIVQAVGRAMRRARDSAGIATIIVPIVIPNSPEEVGDLDPGEFRVLWQVVRALRAHDDQLGIELDSQRSITYPEGVPKLPDKITIEAPYGTSQDLLTQLKALTIRQTTSSWWEGYGHARDFWERHGHLDIPSAHITEGGFALGRWIINARQHERKGWLSSDRRAALDELGMIWNRRELPWQQFREEVRAYREQHGHLLVPQNYVNPRTGYRLGSKINSVRSKPASVPMTVRRELDELGMIWDARDLAWQRLWNAAYVYRQAYGHLNVPKNYRDPDTGYGLGAALARKRQRYHRGELDEAEHAALAELGMVFDAPTSWEVFLAACDRHLATGGTLDVPKDFVDDQGYPLGARVAYYRSLNSGTKRHSEWGPQRKAELDRRGMVWRTAPARDITPAEAERLRATEAENLGKAIVQLLDEQNVTQSSIAEALGLHRSFLNTKIKRFRQTGRWSTRKRHKATGRQ